MADIRSGAHGAAACNDRCGCPSPCPGGVDCMCTSQEAASGDDHKRCSCGEHCSCNPCTCSKTEVTGTGKAFSKCSAGCACTTCAA